HLTVVPAQAATYDLGPAVMGPASPGEGRRWPVLCYNSASESRRARSVAGETVAAIVPAHRAGASIEATVARAYARIRAHGDPAIFITLREEADAIAEAKALAAARSADRALYGVPVAIKDNIDVAGMPTTAACPAFAYVPDKDATCVARLKRAGAIVIGKTNLDQFATGLEGVRTPYGIARNLFDRSLIPGGSSGVRLGVPMPQQRLFFGDDASAAAYEEALARLARLGAKIVPFDMEPFFEAARMLYEGPWVAERTLAARTVIEKAPHELHPAVRQILLSGAKWSAADTLAALYRLEELRRVRDQTFRAIEVMALPTVPTVHTIEKARADPIALNRRLGTYTNFVNLLDLCALA